MINKYLFTGAPGAGKTTTLEALKCLGFEFISETAREIIKCRMAQGLPPRPSPQRFAYDCLRTDCAKYDASCPDNSALFYDRGVPDALYMVNNATRLSSTERANYIDKYAYNKMVFIFSPWKEIYHTDDERDQSYHEAETTFNALLTWYKTLGYQPIEVPKETPKARAHFVITAIESAV